MSQHNTIEHIKSNTDFSNASNFDADAIGLMPDISHQESNATDESSASVLMPNSNNITLMSGLNHLQSSPLQGFANPNVNAPKLDIPPSKVAIPPDVTPNGGHDKNNNNNNNNGNNNNNNNNNNNIKKQDNHIKLANKPPDLQLSLDRDRDDEKASGPHHPITPNTDQSYNYQTNISPVPPMLPPPNTGINPSQMAQFAAMSQFIPHFWTALQQLTTNVNSIQRQFSKLDNSKLDNLKSSHPHHQLNSLSRSSTQTRYRSQSNSSTNSLRTQTSIASSTYNLYNEPPGAKRDDKLRKNRRKSPHRNGPRKIPSNYLEAQRASISYGNYSQYPRRKSIGPGNKFAASPKGRTGSISPFASSPKAGNNKQYGLTADSLELLNISQRRDNALKKISAERERERRDRDMQNSNDNSNDSGNKKHPNKQRNRSKSFFVNASKDSNINNKRKRRTTITDATSQNKINDEQDDNSSVDEDYNSADYDEISLYSDKLYNTNTMNSAISVLESSPNINNVNNVGGLSIIHSSSEVSQINSSPSISSLGHNHKPDSNLIEINVDEPLFEDLEGNGNAEITKNFHRKKKHTLDSNKQGFKYRKPSSSAASNISSRTQSTSRSGHASTQSQVSISSIAITEIEPDNITSNNLSRSVPHSPSSPKNKSYFMDKTLNNHKDSVLSNNNTTNNNNNIQRDTPRIKPKRGNKRRQSTGASTHHLYPTPTPITKTTTGKSNNNNKLNGDVLLPKKAPLLKQSHSAHTIVTTPQRPNTPTNSDNNDDNNHKNNNKNNNNNNNNTTPTTPTNTPQTFQPSMLNTVNVMSPPINGMFDASASIYNYGSSAVNITNDNKNGKRKASLTPPQEDKEYIPLNISDIASNSNDTMNQIKQFQLEPLTFLDDEKQSDDEMDGGKIVIVDEDEMIINGDKVQELPLNPYNNHNNENLVEEAANILYTTSLLPLTSVEQQNGEDSVSISMNSSRPPSIRGNKYVHFDMNSIHGMNKVSSMEDIEENKESADEEYIDENSVDVVNHHNLLPSLVNKRRSRDKSNKTKRKQSETKENDKIVSKLKKQNSKNRRGNLRKLRLSQQNLRAHNGLNQLKIKLMDAKLEKKDVAKMSNEQLQEMLIYINRIQWLILDEKQKRECCMICGIPSTSFMLLLPCRHQTICSHCSSNLQMCPICHQNVQSIVKPRKK